jgi:hypothetical protein
MSLDHHPGIVPGKLLRNNDPRHPDEFVKILEIVDRHGKGLIPGRCAVYQAGRRKAAISFLHIWPEGSKHGNRGWTLITPTE